MYPPVALLVVVLVELRIYWHGAAEATALADHACYTNLDVDESSEMWCQDRGITGTIPPGIAAFTKLEKVWLQGNQLTGSIPPELMQLTGLTDLSLEGNKLGGTLDGALIAKFFTENPPDGPPKPGAKRCNLDRNKPGFSLPSDVSALVDFDGVWIGGGLGGSIPVEWGTLTNLKDLAFGGINRLTGDIPAELSNLVDLTYFEVTGSCSDRDTGPRPPHAPSPEENAGFCNNIAGETPEWCLEVGRTCKGISDYDCSGFENSVPRMDARTCKECGENSGAVFAFWILTLLGMGLLFTFVYRHRKRLLPPKRKAMMVVLWSHLQVMVVILGLEIQWPDELVNAVQALKFVSIQIPQANIECTPVGKALLKLKSPSITMVLLVFVGSLFFSCFRCCQKARGAKPGEGGLCTLAYRWTKPLFLPLVAVATSSLMGGINGMMNGNEDEFFSWAQEVACSALILLFNLVWLFRVGRKLQAFRKGGDEAAAADTEFVREDYSEPRYYWFVVDMSLKVVFMFIGEGTGMLAVLVVYFGLLFYFSPVFGDPVVDRFEKITVGSQIVFLGVSLAWEAVMDEGVVFASVLITIVYGVVFYGLFRAWKMVANDTKVGIEEDVEGAFGDVVGGVAGEVLGTAGAGEVLTEVVSGAAASMAASTDDGQRKANVAEVNRAGIVTVE